MGTTAAERSDTDAAVGAVADESYEDWLTRTVDAMPPFTEAQQRELRDLLRSSAG